jgi:hypothetical protein
MYPFSAYPLGWLCHLSGLISLKSSFICYKSLTYACTNLNVFKIFQIHWEIPDVHINKKKHDNITLGKDNVYLLLKVSWTFENAIKDINILINKKVKIFWRAFLTLCVSGLLKVHSLWFSNSNTRVFLGVTKPNIWGKSLEFLPFANLHGVNSPAWIIPSYQWDLKVALFKVAKK